MVVAPHVQGTTEKSCPGCSALSMHLTGFVPPSSLYCKLFPILLRTADDSSQGGRYVSMTQDAYSAPRPPAGNQKDLTPRPSPDVVAKRLGDSVVLVHMGTNRISELNRTGARLWELLTEGYDRAEIEERMLQEFDVNRAQLTAEIDALLSSLQAEGLVSFDDHS